MARVCSLEENAVSAAKYKNKKSFGPASVSVEAVDAATNTVDLIVNGVAVKCLWTDDYVMPLCPSTLESSFDVLPAVGTEGTLYVSTKLIADYQLNIHPKWPDAYDGEIEYRALRIWPTKIELSGYELSTGTMKSGTIDLLNPDLSQNGQPLIAAQEAVPLQVSPRGAQCFRVPWSTLDELQLAVQVIGGSNDPSMARDKAKAWEAVAVWEELLGSPGAEQRPDYQQVRSLLDQLKR